MNNDVMRALNLVLNMNADDLNAFAETLGFFSPDVADRLEFLLGVGAMERCARDAALREKDEESALL